MTWTPDSAFEAVALEPWRLTPDRHAQYTSRGAWIPWEYLRFMGRQIAMAIARGNGRIIINAPPRHGKSEFCAFRVPVWFLDNFPDKRLILCSYDSRFAGEWGRKVRDEFRANDMTRTSLRMDTTNVSAWQTPEGGGMVCAGVCGPVTGRGGDVLIIDDPIKDWREAYSVLGRERRREWFQGTFYTRCEPGATIIMDMTRWHADDLAGWLIDTHSDKWTVLSFPAMAKPDDLIGRKPGEALCPDRYDVDALRSIRSAVGDMAWQSEFQQEPRELGIGRLYSNFSDANLTNDIILREDLPLTLSLDFNISPGMHALAGQYDPGADLFTSAAEFHKPRMTTIACMDAFFAWVEETGGWRWPELHVFGDASGTAEWSGTGESDYQLVRGKIQAKGLQFRIRVPRANPPVVDRINAVNEALNDVDDRIHWKIDPGCKRLLEDLKRLKSDEHGLIDKREHRLSHSSDAEGYRIHYLRPMIQISTSVGEAIGFGA